jgi:endoglucanase
MLARAGALPKNITVFSLETSAPRGGAEIGRGPVVRVGDRLSIFDSGETARLMNVAAANKIAVQRCLLDGGSCEASAYQLYGYRSVAASIGLGNYHNCAPDGTVQCEYVSLGDYANMVGLCLAVALDPAKSDPVGALRDSMEKRAAGYSPLFRQI